MTDTRQGDETAARATSTAVFVETTICGLGPVIPRELRNDWQSWALTIALGVLDACGLICVGSVFAGVIQFAGCIL